MTATSTRSARVRAAALFALLVVVWALDARKLALDMSIAHFLPRGSDPRVAGMLTALSDGALARTTILDLGGTDSDTLKSAARAVMDELRSRHADSAQSGLDETQQQEFLASINSYSPSTFLPESVYDANEVQRRLEATRDGLGGPMGPLVAKFAAADPLGGSTRLSS
jgi:hypothetical protein